MVKVVVRMSKLNVVGCWDFYTLLSRRDDVMDVSCN